jgi:hypothetical protein
MAHLIDKNLLERASAVLTMKQVDLFRFKRLDGAARGRLVNKPGPVPDAHRSHSSFERDTKCSIVVANKIINPRSTPLGSSPTRRYNFEVRNSEDRICSIDRLRLSLRVIAKACPRTRREVHSINGLSASSISTA